MNLINECLIEATSKLQGKTDNPHLDAELLLAFSLQKSREYLYTWPEKVIQTNTKLAFDRLINLRLEGSPVAYLTGIKEFWSLPFRVTPAVLIPRPETELLVETSLILLTDKKLNVLELGTGSGAIAIALASERDQWKITATDQSKHALNIAEENARKLAADRITFRQGNWFEALHHNASEDKFDAIISNPPYIASNDPHLAGLRYEPSNALVSGPDGLDDISSIIRASRKYLTKSGRLILEHGYEQQEVITELLECYNFTEIQMYNDLNNLPRVIAARTG